MSAANDLLATVERVEPQRDRWGRYVIPDPTTGEVRPFTRATTVASTVADKFGLNQWEQRMVAIGLARRPDLLAQAATVADADSPDAKKLLGAVCADAKEFAGSSTGKNLGSALHGFAEKIDLGIDLAIPAPWDADIAAYRAALDQAGFRVAPEHVERIAVLPELGVAGTFDRLGCFADGRLMVADLKTAKSLDYAWGEIAIQLALYAHAATIFDPASQTHAPMPEVDQDRAVVMHVPVGKATCTLYVVDIAAGWEMVEVCMRVREWRQRKDLVQVVAQLDVGAVPAAAAGQGAAGVPPAPHPAAPALDADLLAPANSNGSNGSIEHLPGGVTREQVEADPFAGLPDENGRPRKPRPASLKGEHTPPPSPAVEAPVPCSPQRRQWLRDRIATVVEAGGADRLAFVWPDGVPTLRQSEDHTDAQVDAIAAVLDQVEAALQLAFPEPDPATPTNRRLAPDDPRVVEMVSRLKALPPDLLAAVEAEAVTGRKMPRLTGGTFREDDLGDLEALVAAAEAEHEVRKGQVANHLSFAGEKMPDGGSGAEVEALAAAASRGRTINPALLTEWEAEALEALADGLHAGFLACRGAELAIDRDAQLVERYGDRRGVNAAARRVAAERDLPAPKSFADVVGDTVLATLVLFAEESVAAH